jgi:hypothetical protein
MIGPIGRIGPIATNHVSRITAMSVKLTIVFFILICFEIGILLVILPWVPSPSWNENYLLVLAADKMHSPWLAIAMKSGYARGAVTGLGILNIMLGVWEIIYFRKTARAFQMEWQSDESNTKPLDAIEATHIRDNRSPIVDQSNGPNGPNGADGADGKVGPDLPG